MLLVLWHHFLDHPIVLCFPPVEYTFGGCFTKLRGGLYTLQQKNNKGIQLRMRRFGKSRIMPNNLYLKKKKEKVSDLFREERLPPTTLLTSLFQRVPFSWWLIQNFGTMAAEERLQELVTVSAVDFATTDLVSCTSCRYCFVASQVFCALVNCKCS